MELTEVTFWDNYWANCKLPSVVDRNLSFERCLAQALKEKLPAVDGEVLEVGCAPGKWLAFMASEFRLKPNGIEYSEAGMKATMENFRLLGLEPGNIRTGDFFKIAPERQFDVVMSLGFIEHFSDVDSVVELHLRWLKPGGVLILGVPNFRGVYYHIQRILDKSILDKHNLDIMQPDYFRELARRYHLQPEFVDYIGSFEPTLPVLGANTGNPVRLLVRGLLWIARKIRRIRWLDSFNTPFISSYILAIYKKSEIVER